MSQPSQGADHLASLINRLEQLSDGQDSLSLGDLLTALGARGFGPLLVTLATFLILPIGMVPGMPGIVAGFFIVIGAHMLMRRTHLWLPSRLQRINISGKLIRGSVDKARPVAKRLRPLLAPRLVGIVESPLIIRLIGLIVLGTGTVVLIIGFIPGFPFVMSFHILLLGLGLTGRDGLITLFGMVAILPEVILMFWLWP
ncbi:exopolysaccharide biosynthesis protein [Actibacterium lipolyticum]|uniref:Exopolysaccharide synthesis, ExoD n=1 Tax=Actibacterium lipolyticum TaxID=1524263 RepID=A0A238JU50_9RHOB|nr:exopolysaccharide biosynthesis protein [Actibacterium lipolyticum]SMX34160.1 Exopolysaccharide synthesis, ExoD [Actibacterium lipolyticum]